MLGRDWVAIIIEACIVVMFVLFLVGLASIVL